MTKQELLKFICDIYGIDECNSMILRQINKYVTEHRCDYIDIARALSYFVDVEGKTPDIKYGIGIVPDKLEESKKYFEKLRREREDLEAAHTFPLLRKGLLSQLFLTKRNRGGKGIC